MAEKKNVTVKKGAKTKIGNGSTFECESCGLVLRVDTTGNCDHWDCLVCCDKPMKQKK